MRLPPLSILVASWLVTDSSVSAFVVPQSRHSVDTSVFASVVDTPLRSVNIPSSGDGDNLDLSSVEFPPPLSQIDRFKRAATFWSTAVPIVANYYGIIGKTKMRELMGQELDDEEIEKIWIAQHEDGAQKLAETITDLKGFYVKTAQIISARQDLFPKQYIDALSGFADNLDPMPTALARAVIAKELLMPGEKFEDVFSEFDEAPLGAASVAQVHRAVLTEKYGGPREVAVKIQRPSIESKLMADIANLKVIAKQFQDLEALPLDYYTVFAELEKQLSQEFDFVTEATNMERIYNSLIRSMDGSTRTELPLVMPRVVTGLVSKRVLVMDYLHGVPLSRAREEMEKNGIDPESPEAKLFGRKLLTALTEVFGRNILETGFFHADPHPGNIFVLRDGSIGLIDFGQVKQISGRNRETLCKVMIALDEREGDDRPEDLERIGSLALELGVELNDDAQPEAAAAVGMWLFDGTIEQLPGGYDSGELSPNSPVRELKSFPQDLVLAGRSTILIKGLSSRLGIPWNLASEWAPIARNVLDGGAKARSPSGDVDRVRFREVWSTLKMWGSGRTKAVVKMLPDSARSRLAGMVLKVQELRSRRKVTKKP
ncbi:protein kinase UbiB [Seminavis robusta]|uniref:Protein kinase UbiB n=1 Tax=Seminavis robusta TaxID=568900 RepID=A0A9N8DGT8_9STRA|nr:protein kinase UbiB [Seminavis robusta]|eukprot:Sro83_g044240.1 protein kinase UbiB (601) ;mRNA; f:28223-30386